MAASPAQLVEGLLGAPLTLSAPEKLAAYILDGAAPEVAAFPETPEQVAALLALASSRGWGVVPWGGGHGMGAGAAPRRYQVALCLSRLEKLVEHDEDNLTLIGEGGLMLADANRRMALARQFLPLGFPGDRSTLGGIVAAARPVLKRMLYGDVRDQLIGIRVALPDGSLVRYGRKVIKNVAGYDMNKLFLGSQGMLGVVVETIFKLCALPDEEGCVPGAFEDFASAASAARALAASAFTPAYLLLLDSGLAAAFRREAGVKADMPQDQVLLLAGFEGRGVALRRQVEGAMQIMGSHGGQAGQPMGPLSESSAALLTRPPPPSSPPPPPGEGTAVENTGAENGEAAGSIGEDAEAGQPGSGNDKAAPALYPRIGSAPALYPRIGSAPALRLRIGAPPGALAALCDQVRTELATLDHPAALLADYGAGAVQAVLPWPRPEALKPLTGWIGSLRGALQQQHGYVAIQSAPAELKQAVGVWGDMEGEGKIMARIMARLDPSGIMAPGRFLQSP